MVKKLKLLVIDLIANDIILDYLKKTVHNLFTIIYTTTTNIQGGVL